MVQRRVPMDRGVVMKTSNQREPGHTGAETQEPDRKVWGEKLKAYGRVIAAVLGAIALAGAALIGSCTTLKVKGNEMDSRTFDVMSRREASVQALQGQIFSVFAKDVVGVLEVEDQKVALLAALHSNFSDFFDTRPVFEAFAEDIKDMRARHELRRLAKRVARRQAGYIIAHQGAGDDSHTTHMSVTVRYPDPGKETFRLADHDVILEIVEEPDRYHERNQVQVVDSSRYKDLHDLGIDDVADFVRVRLTVSENDVHDEKAVPDHDDVRDNNEVKNNDDEGFNVSYMDVPYIDNLWIEHEKGEYHRLAVLLKDIDKVEGGYEVHVEVLHFPGDFFTPTERPPAAEFAKGEHKN